MGLRGQLTGWAVTDLALADGPRFAPIRVGPPSSGEVRPSRMVSREGAWPGWDFGPDEYYVRCLVKVPAQASPGASGILER